MRLQDNAALAAVFQTQVAPAAVLLGRPVIVTPGATAAANAKRSAMRETGVTGSAADTDPFAGSGVAPTRPRWLAAPLNCQALATWPEFPAPLV
jgi:hypothetical protein